MQTADFNFVLPPELIAQHPAPQRDHSRLLVLHRESNSIEHKHFRDVLEFFRAGDVLVLNNSRVIPARLRGVNAKTGGAFEILLLEANATNDWWAMMKPGKRARIGTAIQIQAGRRRGNESRTGNDSETPHVVSYEILATVMDTNDEGHRRLKFSGNENILSALDELGEVPLPPYITRVGTPVAEDRARYQTVFAQPAGSVAAPTAGLHFTTELLDEIRARGVDVQFVTLHVGLGTFAPVKADLLEAHVMHEERFEVSEAAAKAVNAAKTESRRVIAVGTTSVRVLESALGVPPSGGSGPRARVTAPPKGGTPNRIFPGSGRTLIFIHPPHEFKIVDALLTNFHLPCSTLLMLVSAFASPGGTRGREMILSAYAKAIRDRYRFFSYGDAMLIS
ncbi:MAG: tRNA preQ1(34) S-adenosylmethionine ribosyltransferase-isomerase QueA [Pedosphaera sp.]|nr:tRNA preQ1(34) S-adenosylmethionine ribosyltransferase-isomerase QueA [Pedosphaera sp.]